MSCCRRSAERRAGGARRLRGLTLIELLVAQVIVGIIAAGMFALIGGMTRSFHEEHGAAEAQIRLREASSVLMRSLQGIGGNEGKAGYLVMRDDGGPDAADSLSVFRADYGVCGGVQAVLSVEGGNRLRLAQHDFDGDTFPDCPLENMVGCRMDDITGRVLLVEGQTRSAQLLVTAADDSTCELTLGTSAVQSLQLQRYRDHFGSSASTPANVISELGAVQAARFGNAMTFSVADNALWRTVNGANLTRILSGVYDLQIVTAHDLPPGDGAITAAEWNHDGALTGASPDNFFGVRVGLITYGQARGGIEQPAPQVFANRFHNAAPKERRYRASWMFAAARNR
jgi:prepilin-type N-terminal cleavage/methylation domain-containing protein